MFYKIKYSFFTSEAKGNILKRIGCLLNKKDILIHGFDNYYNWLEYESEHFIFKYIKEIESLYKLQELVQIFEKSYESISKLLKIQEKPIFKIYLTPSRHFCCNHKMISQNCSILSLKCAIIILNEPIEVLIKNIRHELTHLLAYYWDLKIYHIEMLEEGLACYLSDPKVNYHEVFINKIEKCIKNGIYCDLTLYIQSYSRTVDYHKATSFVKYLIETYGIEKFKELYIKSAIEKSGRRYFLNGQILSCSYLFNLIGDVYQKNPLVIQIEWLKELEYYLKKEKLQMF
ncbi:hypothetical protein NLC29_00425 [Candidatus Aminicenantes bacterium AH-873-B07]|nr:hypothetical protein [Candidatus Aminicenantes bacterium AH-873-B07]